MQELAAVLFDWDGTLVDSGPARELAYQEALLPYIGRRLTLGEYLAVPEPLTHFAGAAQPAAQRAWHDAYARCAPDLVRPFPGVAEALDRLAALGLATAVVTAKDRDLVEPELARWPALARHAAVCVCQEDAPRSKPHPDPLWRALAALGVPAGRALYVGDYPTDVRAARAAGCWSAGALWGCIIPAALAAAGPDLLLATPADLVAAVARARPAHA